MRASLFFTIGACVVVILLVLSANLISDSFEHQSGTPQTPDLSRAILTGLAAMLGLTFALSQHQRRRRTVIDQTRHTRNVEESQLKLTEQKRFLQDVFGSIQDGISVLDTDLIVRSVNPTMERWYAHSLPLVGKKCHEVYHCSSTPCQICPSRRAIETREPSSNIVPKIGSGGEVVGWLALYAFPWRDVAGGEIKGAIEYVRDITETRQAEEALRESQSRYRTLIEAATDVVYTLSPDGLLTSLNPAFERITAWKATDCIGKPFRNLAYEEDAPIVETACQRALKGLSPAQGEVRVRIRSGQTVVFEFTCGPLMQGGQVTGVFGIARDITSRKKLENQLRQSQKMDAIGQLAGGIAHDFNNLLTAISGFSELLMEQLDKGSPLRKDLQEIEKASAQAASLTQQLLAFSRQQMLQPKVLDLNAVVQDTDKMLRRLIGEDIVLETLFGSAVERIKADLVQIEQVILNLAVNARDAMPNGGKMTLSTEMVTLSPVEAATLPDARPGRFVCMSVKDTGIGMDSAVVSRIFEPFFTTKEKGTGLGLATVYGVVKQHDGWIDVHSEQGKGTTFRVFIPAFSVPLETMAETDHQPAARSKGHGERILLIEDRKEVRDLLIRALGDNGYSVWAAESSDQAIQLFEREKGRFDLVFADVVLPDMSGVQIAEWLRRENPHIRILLGSGYTDEKSQWDAIRLKGTPFLQKPYNLSVLLDTVHHILHPTATVEVTPPSPP